MIHQEPLEKEEFQTAQESTVPVEPLPHAHYIDHRDGLIEPIVKEYMPIQVGVVIFSIITLALIFFGKTSNMWGLIE
ncbi:hypothetical protein QOZ98_000023 [Planomicrobium stackebrandtii]|uniref:Uncharacterized protein n=1 Tax=Planomicrobium stackebrandtii TaxID=253160 RepID=A0ABU0GPH0_9BACL|nr:hypothetical protein [Planomicrobium stackebrandtii]MDQ0427198.1 hypothetical protein [Planomicrobium stackebrandtii]